MLAAKPASAFPPEPGDQVLEAQTPVVGVAGLSSAKSIAAIELAKYILNTTIPAMDEVREVADALEKIVTDDLWPLPKYSEILFVK